MVIQNGSRASYLLRSLRWELWFKHRLVARARWCMPLLSAEDEGFWVRVHPVLFRAMLFQNPRKLYMSISMHGHAIYSACMVTPSTHYLAQRLNCISSSEGPMGSNSIIAPSPCHEDWWLLCFSSMWAWICLFTRLHVHVYAFYTLVHVH